MIRKGGRRFSERTMLHQNAGGRFGLGRTGECARRRVDRRQTAERGIGPALLHGIASILHAIRCEAAKSVFESHISGGLA